jgi:ribosomal-protein-alanine N-acetyltransferase
MFNFHPFPILKTENLIMREIAPRDREDLFMARKDPRMHEFTDTVPDETREDTEKYMEKMAKGVAGNQWIIWAIEHRNSQKVIGSICIWNLDSEGQSGELGFGIIPDYQGRGLMQEALRKVVEYGLGTMNLAHLDAFTEEMNVRSRKLLEKCRFGETGRVDDPGYHSDRVFHMVVYQFPNPGK